VIQVPNYTLWFTRNMLFSTGNRITFIESENRELLQRKWEYRTLFLSFFLYFTFNRSITELTAWNIWIIGIGWHIKEDLYKCLWTYQEVRDLEGYGYTQCYFSKEICSGIHRVTQNFVQRGGRLVFLSGNVQNILVCLEEDW
jgi:hypothetical protein